jgi:hypothetical protein
VLLKPWMSGPRELLDHGLQHLEGVSDFDRRMALICIDNSVELMIKTFLGLPRRASGLQISRAKFEEAARSFPGLLDALEEFGGSRLNGIDLSDIEWFHRLRNELYHAGNGLTVERQKVEIYAQIAGTLHENLFGQPVPMAAADATLGSFISKWIELEKMFTDYAAEHSPRSSHGFTHLQVMSAWLGPEYEELRKFRNTLVHHAAPVRQSDLAQAEKKLERLVALARSKISDKS